MFEEIRASIKASEIGAVLSYGKDLEQRYLTGVNIVDPVLIVITPECSHVATGGFEVERFRKEATRKVEIHNYKDLIEESPNKYEGDLDIWNEKAGVFLNLMKKAGVDPNGRIGVFGSFPAGIYNRFPSEPVIHPNYVTYARRTKDEQEIGAIDETQANNKKLMEVARDIIAESTVSSGTLQYKQKSLTVGEVKKEIESKGSELGLSFPSDTIVSCGGKSADPHYRGAPDDKLKAGETIVVDIFPRSKKTGYCGDMTRTFFKGNPKERLRQVYETVLEAQEVGINTMKELPMAKDVYAAVCKVFRKNGIPTLMEGAINTGFIHSFGHSVGLEVHDPSDSSLTMSHIRTHTLVPNEVYSAEPGCYIPNAYGIRIEDLVVTRKGQKPKILGGKTFPKQIDEVIL